MARIKFVLSTEEMEEKERLMKLLEELDEESTLKFKGFLEGLCFMQRS